MIRLLFALVLALLGCDAVPTKPEAPHAEWGCYTSGPVSKLVLMRPCDGLACLAVTISGDTIYVPSRRVTSAEACR